MKTTLTILLALIAVTGWGQTKSPEAWYKFESTNTYEDASGNGHTALPRGDVGYDPVYGGISLGGTDDYVTIPAFDKGTQVIISLWYRASQTISTYKYLFTSADSDSVFYARGLATNTVKMYTDGTSVIPGVSTTINDWHHIVCYYNKTSGIGRMWHDNSRIITTDSTLNTYFDSKDSMYIGVDIYRNADWVGNIGEIMIFSGFAPSNSFVDSIFTGKHLDETPRYNPTAGRHARFFKGGVEKKDKADEYGFVYWVAKSPVISESNPPSESFTIYNSWDFDDETLGEYTDAEFTAKFGDVEQIYSHNSASIVEDTVDGTVRNVMRVTHEAEQVGVGFQAFVDLLQDYNEIYLSYRMKYSKNFNSTAGHKLPGLGALPDYISGSCPTAEHGFGGINLAVFANRLTTYHYDNTKGYCPWMGDDYAASYLKQSQPIFLNNGTYYDITKRIVVNTFTDGVANADGIIELWVNGVLLYQMNDLKLILTESADRKIDELRISNFYGGTGDKYEPATQCYAHFTDFKIYLPNDDPTVGTYDLHSSTDTIITPNTLSVDTVYAKTNVVLGTGNTTIQNSQYGSSYTACKDETWLIDAGAGNTVTFEITDGSLGNYDCIFIYDGNENMSVPIEYIIGLDASITGSWTSTGRYMFIRFSTSKLDHGAGFTGYVHR